MSACPASPKTSFFILGSAVHFLPAGSPQHASWRPFPAFSPPHLITFLPFLFLCLSLHPLGHLQDGVIRDEDARGRVHAREEDG